MRTSKAVAWGLVGWLLGAGAAPAAEPVPADRFEKLHALLKPQGAERKWEQIPWLTDLWQARKQAAEQGKPILLWEMDGHPMGCT